MGQGETSQQRLYGQGLNGTKKPAWARVKSWARVKHLNPEWVRVKSKGPCMGKGNTAQNPCMGKG